MLSDTYAEADENDGADAVLVDYAFCDDGTERAFLDNGCFVVRAKESDNALRMARLKYKTTQTHMIESQETAYGPWTGANTDFEYVTDSKSSIEGDEEILEEIT